MFVSEIVRMPAEKNLNRDLSTLNDKITDVFVPRNDDNVHRQIVDFTKALREVKRLSRELESKVGNTKLLPFALKYLNDPND